MPSLVSIQVGKPQSYQVGEETWTTGIFKRPVEGRVSLGKTLLAGDGQANRKHHGGQHRAVCCFPVEHYPFWRETLMLGEAFGYGAFGENFTLAEMTEEAVCIGDIYAVGTARVQVSQPRMPCANLGRKWNFPQMAQEMQANGHSGFYLRVLETGEVGAGDAVTLLERLHPAVTVAYVNEALYRRAGGIERYTLLALLPELSPNMRKGFQRRLTSLPP